VEKYSRGRQVIKGSIILSMRIACSITKAIDTQLEYVIIIAFPRQQYFCERVTVVSFRRIFIVVKYWELHHSNHIKKLGITQLQT
jgi:hypothetical protein